MRSLRRRIAAGIAKLLGVDNIYEAGRRWSSDRSWVPGFVRDVRFDADPMTRWEIVRKARYFERNSGIVNRLVDIFEQFTVGAGGLQLIPASSDEAWNKAAAEWWDGWCKNCDLNSRHPFGVIQSLIAREWFVDGEVFIVKTYGEGQAKGFPARPRIQLLESHRVASPGSVTDTSADPKMVEGIELNGNGRPIAYHVKVGDDFQRIIADNIEHVFEPSRVGQYRGLSFMYPVMNDLHDLDDLQMLEMKAAKNAAKMTNVITTASGQITDDDVIKQRFSRTVTNSQGDSATETRERYYKQVFGGEEIVLKRGDDIKQFSSDRPTVTTQAYWDYLTAKICAGVGISKLLVLPFTLQGTVTRSDLDVANAFFRARSAVLAATFERIYEWAIGWAVLNEPSLANFPKDWKRVTCRPPRAVNVDVGRNSTAMLEELKAGTRTFQDIYAEQGEDYREQLEQRAKEAGLLKQLAEKYKVDPQQIAELAVTPPPPAPPQGNPAMPQNRIPVFNGPTGAAKPWFTVRNEAPDKPVEILIYDQIGKDYWSENGVGAKDFAEALAEIPMGREIVVAINSPGGNMWDGLAIAALLKQRKDKVVCRVDGIAASIASIIAIAGRECQMAANSLLMIHNPTALCMGEADDMREMADMLDKHRDVLSKAYEDKSGKPKDEIVRSMDDETWMTPTEAKAFGLCDKINEDMAVAASATGFDLSNFRRVPASLRGQTPPDNKTATAKAGDASKGHTMNRTQILALLKQWGVKVEDNATDEALIALVSAGKPQNAANPNPAPTPAPAPVSADGDLAKQVRELREANAAERRMRLGKAVDALVEDGRVPLNLRDEWLNRVVADETVLASLQALPKPQRQEPVSVETVDADVTNIVAGIRDCNKPMDSWNRGNNPPWKQVAAAATERGRLITRHMGKLAGVYNTNTIATELKRQVILQQAIVDFVRKLTPIRQFATVFSPVPLEGTDKIDVPFYDLDTTTPEDWNSSTGYATGNTTTDKREVTIDKRKYLGGNFTSSDLARQPFLNTQQLMTLKAQKLASAVWTDVLSVITAANYSTAAFSGPAASFDSDDLADIKLACKTWPDAGRSLFVESSYDANLLKDVAFKYALNAASDSAIKEGRIYPRVFGFDYIENPNIPDNSEYLVGFAAFMSAILFAQAPIPPTEEVRRAGTMYDMTVDPQTGAVFETRSFGSNTLDSSTFIVECNYGYVKGNANALKRLTSQ